MPGEGIFLPFGVDDQFTPAASRMSKAGESLRAVFEKMGKAAVQFGKEVGAGEKATTSWGKAINQTVKGLKGLRDFKVKDLAHEFGDMSVMGIGMGEMLREGAKSGMEFEKQVIKMGFAGDMTKEKIGELSDGAKHLANESEFSRNEFLLGETALVKYGRTASQALNDMGRAAKFASVNDLALNDAQKMGSKISLLYYNDLNKASEVQDIMTNTALKANVPVTELAGVLEQLGPIAHGSHVSLGEMSSMLAIMTRSGMDASDASTALRMSMARAGNVGKNYSASMLEIRENYQKMKEPAEKMQYLIRELGPRAMKLEGFFRMDAKAAAELAAQMGNSAGVVDELNDQFEQLSSEKKLAKLNNQFKESAATLAGPMVKVLGFVTGLLTKMGSGFRTFLVGSAAVLAASGAIGYLYGGISKLFPLITKVFTFVITRIPFFGRLATFWGAWGTGIMFVVSRLALVISALVGAYNIIKLLIMGVQELGIVFGKQGTGYLNKNMQARVAAAKAAGQIDSNGNRIRGAGAGAGFTVGQSGSSIREKSSSVTKETSSGITIHGPVHMHLPATAATQRDGLVDGVKKQLRSAGR